MSLILVVDDEPALLDVVSEFVEMIGHEVVRAHDGEEALALVQTRRPELVITDHMMPRKTGLALTRDLRSNPSYDKIPVIIMSAVHPKGLDGDDVYIKKPFDLRDLERLIQQGLDKRAVVTTPVVSAPMSGEEMVNWVAHAMKNPIGVAYTQLQVLERSTMNKLDDRDRQGLARVQRSVEKMRRLVDSLLDATRLAEGKVELALAEHDFNDFTEKLVREWRALEPKASFTLRLPNETVRARFDPQWLGHVVENLLSNAVRHGAGGAEPISVTVVAGAKHVELCVQDHGLGIDESVLPHLFQRFRRGEDGHGGHGLGLFIAAEVTRLHGGTIDVRSTKGSGATFSLKLKRA